jgi:hypothetical protein
MEMFKTGIVVGSGALPNVNYGFDKLDLLAASRILSAPAQNTRPPRCRRNR